MEKKVKKTVKRKTSKKVKTEEVVKKLNDREMFEMELFNTEEKERAARKQFIQSKMENNKLKIMILEMEGKVIEEELVKLNQERSDKKGKYNKFIEKLKERLEIKENFGFDPDTGEVKE